MQKPTVSEIISKPDQNGYCKDCNRRVTFQGKAVEFESCKNCFHGNWQQIATEEFNNTQDVV